MILPAIQQVVRLYQGRGHVIKKLDFEGEEEPIHTILADNEFSALRESVEEWGIDVHIVSKQEHVLEVEDKIESSRNGREESYKHSHTEICQRK
jgi:putative heme iron utilization protein